MLVIYAGGFYFSDRITDNQAGFTSLFAKDDPTEKTQVNTFHFDKCF